MSAADVKMEISVKKTIIEVKHLKLNQFSVGEYLLERGKWCCRAIKV